jgi:hypothetical protein
MSATTDQLPMPQPLEHMHSIYEALKFRQFHVLRNSQRENEDVKNDFCNSVVAHN